MGVPGFFSWILHHCNLDRTVEVFNTSKNHVSELFLDSNSIIYNVANQVSNEQSLDKIEKEIITKTIEHIDELIKFINPTDLVYVSIDGVAPCAKIMQQRNRRYLANYQEEKINLLRTKYHLIHPKWTTLNITPGTIFMDKLHQELLKYCDVFNKNNKCKMIYSSANDYGEGEHKIMDYINSHMISPDKTRYIYGLDADLIFLSMIPEIDNLLLIRENITPSTKEYVYQTVHINRLKNNIYEICKRHDPELKFTQNLINDIIFICFFFGNDFIPDAQIINIRDDIDTLIQKYIYVKKDFGGVYLTNSDSINITFFIEYLHLLSEHEMLLYQTFEYQKRLIRFNLHNKRIREVKTEGFDRDKFNLENPSYDYLHFADKFSDHKHDTYKYYLHTDKEQQKIIDNVCKMYLDGMMWIFDYYFQGIPKLTQLWSYQYPFSPFLSDLYKYVTEHKYNLNVFQEENDTYLDVIHPEIQITPKQQLICVIPYRQLNIIDSELFKKVKDLKQYKFISPVDYKIFSYLCLQFYKCKAAIPYIDFEKIIRLRL